MTKSRTSLMGNSTSIAETPPVDPGRGLLIGTSELIGNRDPFSIRRWIVEWTTDGDVFALAGPLDFVIELGNALFGLRGDDKVDAVFLWPCVSGTPVGAYTVARETLRAFFHDDAAHAGWAMILRSAGYELPDGIELLELSERYKHRKKAA